MRFTAPVVAFLLASIVTLVPGYSIAADSPVGAVDSVGQGVWCSSFTKVLAQADEKNIPMLVFWANPGCSQCGKLESACKTDEFKAWAAERKLLMAFGYGAKSKSDDEACKKFAKNSSGAYPYIAVYWKSNSKGESILEKFTGRTKKMGHGSDPESSLAQQLMDAVDNILPDWEPGGGEPEPKYEDDPVGGDFLVGNTEEAHLEAIAGSTAIVTVPLIRTEGIDTSAINELFADDMRYAVEWKRGESRRDVDVVIPQDAVSGDDIALVLKFNGEVVAESAIRVVDEPENSTDNPAWIGEPFDFGEWTMDIDAAMAKTAGASGNAYTVVFFTGVMWCPWCLGLERNVFASEEFKSWTKENQVALVLLDNTKRSPQDAASVAPFAISTDIDGAAPSLLKCEVGANGRSGAAYMSRKGISEAEAEEILQRNHDLGYLGGWLCAPEAIRSGYPTVLVLDKSGRICGRLVYQADSSKGKDEFGAYDSDLAENMARFRQFVAMADDTTLDEADKFVSTTSLEYGFGESESVRLTVSHNVNAYRLNGVYGRRVTFVADNDSAGYGVSFSVVRKTDIAVALKDSSGSTVGTRPAVAVETIATGVGTLTCDFPDDGEVFLKVSSYANARTDFYAGNGDMETVISFSSTGVPLDLENEYLGTAFQTVVPVLDGDIAVGTMELSSTKTNKIKVKYRNALTRKSVSFSGKWGTPDDYGVATFSVVKSKTEFCLRLSPEGRLTVRVGGLSGEASVAAIDYGDYYGVYVVALPVEVGGTASYPAGTGYAVLKANTSSAKKKGRVSYQVVFPNGKSSSGTGQMVAGENGFAGLTLYVKSGYESLVLPLVIRPNAADAPTHRAVTTARDIKLQWNHSQKKYEFSRLCRAFGSYYDKAESLVDCCGYDNLAMSFDVAGLADSEKYGKLVSIAGDNAEIEVAAKKFNVMEKISKFKLSFSRGSGTLDGKTALEFADGDSVAGTIKAIVLPDWHDCGCFDDDDQVPLAEDIPFVVGFCTFKDKVNGRSVIRSLPLALTVKE